MTVPTRLSDWPRAPLDGAKVYDKYAFNAILHVGPISNYGIPMSNDDPAANDESKTGTDIVSALPNVHDWLSSLLGINLPHLPPLPQTLKNFDKALGRVIYAGGETITSRMDRASTITKSKADATESVMKAAKKAYLADMREGGEKLERAIEYTFGDSVLSQVNREKVARIAYREISEGMSDGASDATSEISDDWLNSFSDLVGKKSNADIQSLWGRILAGEIRQPGSFRLKSLLSMSAIDSQDAQLINKMLSRAVNGEFILRADDQEDLGPFMNLESLDVLTVGGGLLVKRYMLDQGMQLPFVLGPVLILAKSNSPGQMLLPQYALTRFGQDICSISQYTSVDEKNIQDLIGKLKQSNLTVQRAYIVKDAQGTQVITPLIDC